MKVKVSLLHNDYEELDIKMPICYRIEISNGEVDYISRKYLTEYLNNFYLWYKSTDKIKKIEISANVPEYVLHNLDYYGLDKNELLDELMLHRKLLHTIKKYKLKPFAKDISFSYGAWIENILLGGENENSINKG